MYFQLILLFDMMLWKGWNLMAKVCVIGAGPAGMMAAYVASQNGHQVKIFDKNKQLGKKLQLTGHGRCNVTNSCSKDGFFKHVVHNEKFLYSAFSQFSNVDMIRFLKDHGMPTVEEEHGRMFPSSNSAKDVVLLFVELLRQNQVDFHMEETCEDLIVKENQVQGIKTNKDIYDCDVVIITTGGKSFPNTGSNGDGYTLVSKYGIKVSSLYPGLVSLKTKEKFDLAGLSLQNVKMEVKNAKKTIYKGQGDILFTHEGLSGPGILGLSSCVIDQTPLKIQLDFIQDKSIEEVDAFLLDQISKASNQSLKHVLERILPKRLTQYMMHSLDISEQLKANETTKKQRKAISEFLKGCTFHIDSFSDFDQAMVTVGGIKTGQIQPKTMESKNIKGLKFAGEILDVDAKTGGYNLQIAWTTGYVAGNTIE